MSMAYSSKKLKSYRVSVMIGEHREKLTVTAINKREAINKVLSVAAYQIHRVTREDKKPRRLRFLYLR